MKPIIPVAGNPHHVDNLATISLLESQGFEGGDACLRVSLFEQGIVWRELPDEFLFVYKTPNASGLFDRCSFDKRTDVQKEFDWVNFPELMNFLGANLDEWLALPVKIAGLLSYHGEENVFGTSYWEGFKVEEN